MNDSPSPTFVFPGVGGFAIEPAFFCSSAEDAARFHTVVYPGWRRYVETGYSAEKLVEDLTAQIVARAPDGPIRLVGYSAGGHLAYAVALRLVASGREIGGICVIDSFVPTVAPPMTDALRTMTGALQIGIGLIRARRLDELGKYLRPRLRRAVLRLAGNRLVSVVRRIAPTGHLPWILTTDPIFEDELSLRLLRLTLEPWYSSLDREPIALSAPALLIRATYGVDVGSVWRLRCPGIKIIEFLGNHDTIMDRENSGSFRQAFIMGTSEWR